MTAFVPPSVEEAPTPAVTAVVSIPVIPECADEDTVIVRPPDPVRMGLSENESWVDRPDEDWIQNLCVACEHGKEEVGLCVFG